MKNVILITCWIAIALIEPAKAQDRAFTDTLIVRLEGKNQVHITGSSLEAIMAYTGTDSLKQLFIADLDKAMKNNAIADDTRKLHYLVSPNGQRRLKAALDPASEEPFNLEREAKRMELDLPPYEYIIYDIKRSVEIHIYLEDHSNLAMLGNLRLDEAVVSVKKKEAQKHYRIDMQRTETGYKISDRKNSRTNTFEIAPTTGIVLLSNIPSPLLGTDVSFNFNTKYNVPLARIGLSTSYFMLSEYSDGRFTNISAGNFIDLYGLMNASYEKGRVRLFGAEGGMVLLYKDEKKIDTGWKFGMTAGTDRYLITFGGVNALTPPKTGLYYLSLKVPF